MAALPPAPVALPADLNLQKEVGGGAHASQVRAPGRHNHMAIVVNGSCLCNHADFAIEPTEGGYLLEPLRDHHVDDLLVPLAEIGIEWHASAWAFYVPASRWDQDLDEHRSQDSDGHHSLLPFSPSGELLKEGPFPSFAYFDYLK